MQEKRMVSNSRKFNSEKLKSPETSSTYREKLNECLARHIDDNDDINLLKTKHNLLYIRNQSVPRCKHFPPRL
jgi:hypothetical protein